MKKFWLILGVIILVVFFQTSFLAPWFGDYVYPDLLLVFVVLAVVSFGFQATWAWVMLAGLVMDIFAYSKVGTHVIIFILAAYFVSFISRRFAVADRGLGIALVFMLMPIVTALDHWGVPFLNDVSLENKLFTLESFRSIGIITLENLALFFIFYPLFLKLKVRYSPMQYRIGR